MRRECALVNGDANVIDKVDFFTGAKSKLGTTFEWFWDAKAKEVRCYLDEDMVVPVADGGAVKNLAFRTWTLRFGKAVGDQQYEMKESFPEHEYELPVQYVYEIFAGRFFVAQ
jgi:hypothetical protein